MNGWVDIDIYIYAGFVCVLCTCVSQWASIDESDSLSFSLSSLFLSVCLFFCLSGKKSFLNTSVCMSVSVYVRLSYSCVFLCCHAGLDVLMLPCCN